MNACRKLTCVSPDACWLRPCFGIVPLMPAGYSRVSIFIVITYCIIVIVFYSCYFSY